MQPNPHDLINLPGAGNAERELRKAGLWKKSALDILWSIPDDKCPKDVNNKIDQVIEILRTMEAK